MPWWPSPPYDELPQDATSVTMSPAAVRGGKRGGSPCSWPRRSVSIVATALAEIVGCYLLYL